MAKIKSNSLPQSCEACGGKCCRYITVPIERPRTQKDYDLIRWYLLHKNVKVFEDRGHNWFIEFITPCKRLGPDSKCQAYDDRPLVCSDYGVGKPGCEYTKNPYGEVFSSAEEFDRFYGGRRR